MRLYHRNMTVVGGNVWWLLKMYLWNLSGRKIISIALFQSIVWQRYVNCSISGSVCVESRQKVWMAVLGVILPVVLDGAFFQCTRVYWYASVFRKVCLRLKLKCRNSYWRCSLRYCRDMWVLDEKQKKWSWVGSSIMLYEARPRKRYQLLVSHER